MQSIDVRITFIIFKNLHSSNSLNQGEISEDSCRAIVVGDSNMVRLYSVHATSGTLHNRPIEFANPSQDYSIAACWNEDCTLFVVGSENGLYIYMQFKHDS